MNSPITTVEISPAQRDFIRACSEAGVLKFYPNGTSLKSWRISPWFFNAGELMKDAQWLSMLAKIYVDALLANFADTEKNITADVLYWPAYKWIPLAAVAAAEYHNQTGKNIGFASHRKEPKDHGEGWTDFWTKMKKNSAILLDDVMTAGTAIKDSRNLMEKDESKIVGAVVILDRQETEKWKEDIQWAERISALNSISREYGIKIVAALDYRTVRQAVEEWLIGTPEIWAAMDTYFERYGA